MASYVINKSDNELCRVCCYKQQTELTCTSSLTTWLIRCSLFAVLVICMLAVKLLFDRWVISSPSQSFNSLRVVKLSTLLEGCTSESPSRCLGDKPRTNAANSGRVNFSSEETNGLTVPVQLTSSLNLLRKCTVTMIALSADCLSAS